jgi:hypothetical protein
MRPEIPFLSRRESSTNLKEKEHVILHLVRFLREWHKAEGKSREVIDFDLAPNFDPQSYEIGKRINIAPPSKDEIQEFARILEDFSQEVEKLVPANGERMQLEFLKAKLRASQAYCLRRLDGKFDSLDYIEQTMGVRPQEIPEEVLMSQQQKVLGLYKILGLSTYDAPSIREFDLSRMIEDDSIATQMQEFGSRAVLAMADFIKQKINVDYKVVNVQEDEYWLNWADGDQKKFRLRVNTHPRHRGRWNKGRVEVMAAHEIAGHFAQMAIWRENIEKGRLFPVLGLTSTHGPEQVTSEGIAQTLPYFVPKIELSNEATLELELTGLRSMVYNNVHLMVNSGPFNIQDIIQYVKRFLPTESNNEIKRQIKDRTRSPWKQTYLYAYGIGFFRHQLYAKNLTREGKRRLLHFIYNQPTTPVQENQFVRVLLQDPNLGAGITEYQPWLDR